MFKYRGKMPDYSKLLFYYNKDNVSKWDRVPFPFPLFPHTSRYTSLGRLSIANKTNDARLFNHSKNLIST